ncbi:phosphoribosyltransferase [marine bacterium AO1-C]|nr:phosphoribosyltransferase [marine bacterium AO1-C]
MLEQQNLILDKAQVNQKITRIAYQIYENNFQEGEIVFAGIWQSGYLLAQMLEGIYTKITGRPPKMVKVSLNKQTPTQGEVSLDCNPEDLVNKTVILIDDVLNTGRTLAYSLKPFFDIRLDKLQVAVLVDRSHKKFPVAADYVGYELSTTLKEHINVELEDEASFGVYLS